MSLHDLPVLHIPVEYCHTLPVHTFEDTTFLDRHRLRGLVIFKMGRTNIGDHCYIRLDQPGVPRHAADSHLQHRVRRIPRDRGQVPGNALGQVGVMPCASHVPPGLQGPSEHGHGAGLASATRHADNLAQHLLTGKLPHRQYSALDIEYPQQRYMLKARVFLILRQQGLGSKRQAR